MKETGTNQERLSIQYFDGVNSTVQQTIALKTELSHLENARSPIIGVLEKREGQVAVGTDANGDTFEASGNYGLAYYDDGGTLSKGLLRVASQNGSVANIYYLNQSDIWTQLGNDLSNNLSLATCDFSVVDNNLIIVNGSDNNRMISGEINGATTMSDSSTTGSLYNSPKANRVAYYKSRIYLADYYDQSGTELKTTVLRSSYPLGLVSLLDGDISTLDAYNNWIIPLTDIKYIYTNTGMNVYDIYRGNNKVATVTATDVDESSMTVPEYNVAFEVGHSQFLSSDEVWVSGTYSGEKQYRWISNASSIGRDMKQYDTFKLAGGDEDPITMLEPIGNVLMVSNKNCMMTWNDYSLEGFDNNIGCCSKNGYVKRGDLYFIHYTGIYVTSGGVPKLISRKIERYIKGATKSGIENAAMGWKGLSIFCTIGDVTLYNQDGSLWKVLSDVCLEYATADQNWYVHTNVKSSSFETYIASDGSTKLMMNSTSPAKNASYGSEMISNGSFSDGTTPWVTSEEWDLDDGKITMVNA